MVANEYCGSWPPGQEGGHDGFQLQKAREQNVAGHLWLTVNDPLRIKKDRCRLFFDNLRKQANPTNDKLDHEDADAFLAYLQAKLNLPGKQSGLEQLAVVCCMKHPQGEQYSKLRELVFKTLGETNRFAITPDSDEKDFIRLKPLGKMINRADTVVVVCFDQDWSWATNIIRELRQLSGPDASRRSHIFVVGPVDKQLGELKVDAFKFTTVNTLGSKEDDVREQLRRAINRS